MLMTIEQIKKRYFPTEKPQRQAIAEHLMMLTDSEKQRQNDGTYTNATEICKANSIKRIQHYIDVRTLQEKALPEYKTFIQTMEKSIVMCKEC